VARARRSAARPRPRESLVGRSRGGERLLGVTVMKALRRGWALDAPEEARRVSSTLEIPLRASPCARPAIGASGYGRSFDDLGNEVQTGLDLRRVALEALVLVGLGPASASQRWRCTPGSGCAIGSTGGLGALELADEVDDAREAVA
jgi:hypothetical protein